MLKMMYKKSKSSVPWHISAYIVALVSLVLMLLSVFGDKGSQSGLGIPYEVRILLSVVFIIFIFFVRQSEYPSEEEKSPDVTPMSVFLSYSIVLMVGVYFLTTWISKFEMTMIDSLYGFELNEVVDEGALAALKEKGYVIEDGLGLEEWSYRITSESKPVTEVLIYTSADSREVARIEANVRVEINDDYYSVNEMVVRSIYSSLLDDLGSRIGWRWWNRLLPSEYNDYYVSKDSHWLNILEPSLYKWRGSLNSPKYRLSRVYRESRIWTNGEVLLWMYLSEVGDMRVVLQDSSALNAIYEPESLAIDERMQSLKEDKEASIRSKVEGF